MGDTIGSDPGPSSTSDFDGVVVSYVDLHVHGRCPCDPVPTQLIVRSRPTLAV